MIADERVHRLTDDRRREEHLGSVPQRRRWWLGLLLMAVAVAAMALGVHADDGLVLAGGMVTAAGAAHLLTTGDGDTDTEGRDGD